MATINHLKNADAQKKNLTVAFGRHKATGHLCWSQVSGASPNHQITAYNALGEGEWAECEGAFYNGILLPPADYNFHPGALATGLTTGAQQVDPLFPRDVPHSRSAAIGYKAPTGIGNADNANNPPLKFEGIFRTKKCPNFNSAGVQTDFSYSPNPARAIVELLKTYSRLPNLPSGYLNSAAYWLSRIDWGNWTEFRDFHNQTETVDYTTIEDFQGFGLTASFYNGTNFETFIRKFVQPTINFASGSNVLTAGLTPGSFSARFEGFIRTDFTENYTFSLTHDNGVRFWIAEQDENFGDPLIDSWSGGLTQAAGTHTATYECRAGTFYKIKIEWNDDSSPAQLIFNWSSASQTFEPVSNKNLYPRIEELPLYETHVFFDQPIRPSDAIRVILNNSNSIMQDTGGKLRFYGLEQLSSSFALNDSNIDSFRFRRRDLLQSKPYTAYEAQMRDLDLQYLEEPATPLQIQLDYLTRKSSENVKVVNLYNTTRWRARKILQMRARIEAANGLLAEVEGETAKIYPVIAGDIITATHRKTGNVPRTYLVKETVDAGVSESSSTQTIEKRTLTLQEWN